MKAMLIKDVIVAEGRRPLRDIAELAASIREVGLLNPITVTHEHRLIAGYHRLEACKLLGWTEILSHVVTLDATDAELAEIDENLMRHELSVLERGEHLLRRKQIYETKYPETRKGIAGGKARQGSATEIISFANNTGSILDVTPRTIRQEVQIAESIADDVKSVIRDTELADNKTNLLALSRHTPDAQRRAVNRWLAGQDLESALAFEELTQVITESRQKLAEVGREMLSVRDETCRARNGQIDDDLFEQACRRLANKTKHAPDAVVCAIRICIELAHAA